MQTLVNEILRAESSWSSQLSNLSACISIEAWVYFWWWPFTIFFFLSWWYSSMCEKQSESQLASWSKVHNNTIWPLDISILSSQSTPTQYWKSELNASNFVRLSLFFEYFSCSISLIIYLSRSSRYFFFSFYLTLFLVFFLIVFRFGCIVLIIIFFCSSSC